MASASLRTLAALSPFRTRRASNSGGSRPGETRRDVPVLLGHERLDLALAIADQLEGDRLHAPGAQAAPDLVPQDRADLVADQPIEHAARLLRIDHPHVDLAGMLDGLENRLLGDLVEHQPLDLLPVGLAEFLGQMPADGLAFAVGSVAT